MKLVSALSVCFSLLIVSCGTNGRMTKLQNRPLAASQTSYALDEGPIINLQEVRDGFHFGLGLNIEAKKAVDVYAMFGGKVHRYSKDPNNSTNLGTFIELEHEITDGQKEKRQYYTCYCLLSDILVEPGQTVVEGQRIGMTGPSGPLEDIINDTILIIAVYSFEILNDLEKELKTTAYYRFGVYWYDPSLWLSKKEEDDKDSSSFDHTSYSSTTLEELITIAKGNMSEDRSSFTSYGMRKHRISTSLADFPQDIASESAAELVLYSKLHNIPQSFTNLFGSQIMQYFDEVNVVFLVQSSLIPSMREELSLPEIIDLYVIFGFYDETRKNLYLLVNDFQKRE